MTVLAKLLFRKPLNLPKSERNHGLDPDVEIVPRELSAGEAKHLQLPKCIGLLHTIGPKMLNGGPLAPRVISVACPYSWLGTALSSKSKPSCNILAAHRSAETSAWTSSDNFHVFAETGTNHHPTAWGAGTTAERSGIFSKVPGDFPYSLVLRKDKCGKTSEATEVIASHESRPSSASGKLSQDKRQYWMEQTLCLKMSCILVNSSRDVQKWEQVGNVEKRWSHDSIQAGMDMWQGEPHQLWPFRPGFYNVVPVAFDGYYGPLIGATNASESKAIAHARAASLGVSITKHCQNSVNLLMVPDDAYDTTMIKVPF
nr:protein MODIFIER OF SNC1 1 [Ipomoea batatas]